MFACLQIWNKKSRQETDGFKRKWYKHDYELDFELLIYKHIEINVCKNPLWLS